MDMKANVLLFWLSLFLSTLLPAQNTTGVIQFEEKINMHRNLPPDAGDMRAMIPEFRVMQSELLFTATESLYRNVEEEEDEEMGDGQVMIRMQRPDMRFYKNFGKSQKIEQREFMGKQYLIEDAIDQTPWKVGMETQEILGYNCMQAVWEDTSNAERKRTVVAWFAPDIPVSAGPVTYGQLPGMILKVDINNGELQLTATKIDLKAPKKGELEVPTKGEKTTQEEFQKMVDERVRAMGGSSGRGIRIIRN